MQGIEAVVARIGEIEDRIAQFNPALNATHTASVSTSIDLASDPQAQAAFQARLAAAQAQLDSFTGGSSAFSAMGTIQELYGQSGSQFSQLAQFPLNSQVGATSPVDALTMLQRLGLDRSALSGSSIPSLKALAASSAVSGAAAARAAAAPTTSGARNADGIPADLAAYGNGKIPAAALSQLQGESSHRLWAPAAAAFDRMRRDAAAQGISFGITDSYRPLAVQEQLAKTKGLYKNGGLAAVPGTSQHGWGLAVDLKLNSEALTWMRQNAGRYGFVEDTPREPWHWAYKS